MDFYSWNSNAGKYFLTFGYPQMSTQSATSISVPKVIEYSFLNAAVYFVSYIIASTALGFKSRLI